MDNGAVVGTVDRPEGGSTAGTVAERRAQCQGADAEVASAA